MTLVETTLTLGISTLLMSGLSATLFLAAKAVPDASSSLGSTNEAVRGMEQAASELFVLRNVMAKSDKSITFSVADRDNNSTPEYIQYSWSGVAGEPLKRSYNLGTPSTVVDNVYSLVIEYELATSAASSDPQESSETLLASYMSTEGLAKYAVTKPEWIGQLIKPAMPQGATSWRITRAKLRLRSGDDNKGIAKVQVRPAIGFAPASTVIEEVEIAENQLSTTYLWHEIQFRNSGGLDPNAGACILLTWASDATACETQFRASGVDSTDAVMLTSSNSGATWTNSSTQSLLYEIYGTINATNRPEVEKVYKLTAIRLRLQVGADPTSVAQTVVQVLNQPEVRQ